ncbi:MAG TPA: hypothetical protein VFZ53_32425 [Polyangiaceae bacterium]
MRSAASRFGAAFAVLLATVTNAHAEPQAQDKAAAEALFRSGTKLMDEQRYTEACEKFDASNRLDSALGTRLRLADCYDRIGRTASAWALFLEVTALARAQGQTERETVATVRARDLEARLSTLVLRVDLAARPADLEITLSGVRIPRASWNTPIPVDPGTRKLQVRAAGYAEWSSDIGVPAGPSLSSVTIPELRAATETRARPLERSPEQATGGLDAHTVAAYATVGVGVVGLGVAGFLGYRAHSLNQDSLEECSSADANACTQHGKDLRDDALGYARASTATAIGGAALLATGITLFVLSPSDESSKAAAPLFRFYARAADGASLHVEGSWF